jgi:phosphatidylserine/phosphatidylglycerophosphate/cardiolipin synthase-like enzyme
VLWKQGARFLHQQGSGRNYPHKYDQLFDRGFGILRTAVHLSTGWYNFISSAERDNDENLVIVDDPRLALPILRNFSASMRRRRRPAASTSEYSLRQHGTFFLL